jgi:hypothetical protein
MGGKEKRLANSHACDRRIVVIEVTQLPNDP